MNTKRVGETNAQDCRLNLPASDPQLCVSLCTVAGDEAPQQPNIVILLVDE